MGWHINYYKKCSYIIAQIGAIYGHVMDMRAQRQHTTEIWGMVGWQIVPIKSIMYYNNRHARI